MRVLRRHFGTEIMSGKNARKKCLQKQSQYFAIHARQSYIRTRKVEKVL